METDLFPKMNSKETQGNKKKCVFRMNIKKIKPKNNF